MSSGRRLQIKNKTTMFIWGPAVRFFSVANVAVVFYCRMQTSATVVSCVGPHAIRRYIRNGQKCVFELRTYADPPKWIPPKGCLRMLRIYTELMVKLRIVTLEGKEKGGLKAKRSWLVRVESRRYASNFCKAAQTS